MRAIFLAAIFVAFGTSLGGQDVASTRENPLAVLKDEVKRVLDEAQVPFTNEQENSIILMMEDRRQASEDLFGDLLNFQAGPTQGQEADRLRSAIEWMRNEFLGRLQDYLSPEQLAAWSRYQEGSLSGSDGEAQGERPPQQTQYVRINNNAFTSEDIAYRFGNGGGGQGGAEIIQRGGAGAFHGNAEILFRDESLNARNPFANNKPSYQERQGSFDFGGPTIPGRLTTTFAARQNETENYDTIHATTPDGIFSLGVTHPSLSRSFNVRNTYSFSDAHSMAFNLGYGSSRSENQGAGGFTLPERASSSRGRNWTVELRQFSSLSSQTLFENRLNLSTNHGETIPETEGVRINVLDTFNSGGAQNRSEDDSRTFDFSSLYTRLGERLTIKTGMEGAYRSERSYSLANFGGTFTFSSLDAYLAGRPVNYRVNQGDPLQETTQLEMSFFLQNDFKLTPRFTLMYGARYDAQTNLSDYDNISPRLGFAYGIGQATVVRGGAGLFHTYRLPINLVEAQRRLDGTRQHEIIIDNPSYPDPLQSGAVRQTFPSVRVTSPDLKAPYVFATLISVERTFLSNLLFTATYDFQREVSRFKLRNVNAPYDVSAPTFPTSCTPATPAASCIRPDPTRGNVYMLENTGNEIRQVFRVSMRQRFSIFNVTANYRLQEVLADGGPNSQEPATDSYDLRADWVGARGTGFPTSTFSTTVNAELPLGVFLTGTMQTDSGGRYNITTGRDDNRDGNVNDRPPGVPRNSAGRPKNLNFNFNVSKAFFLDGGNGGGGARTNLNLFANMTNAFNRFNPGPPSGVMSSANFGKVTSATNPREIEIGLRFQF